MDHQAPPRAVRDRQDGAGRWQERVHRSMQTGTGSGIRVVIIGMNPLRGFGFVFVLAGLLAACGTPSPRTSGPGGGGGGGDVANLGDDAAGGAADEGNAGDPGNDDPIPAADDPADPGPGDDPDPGGGDAGDDPADDPDPRDDPADDPDPEDDPGDDPIDDPAVRPPNPPGFSGGACPDFQEGANRFVSATNDRRVLLFFPPESDEPPGLMTIWHALGSNADQFASMFQAANVARAENLIVAVPDSCCSQVAEWDLVADLALFDDLLSCLSGDGDDAVLDRRRVYATGFSAGGLWTTQLVMERSQFLAAATIFSGGTGGFAPYRRPRHPVPLLLVDGGPTDLYGGGMVNFDQMMADFASRASSDGHFIVECDHGRGHTIPFDAGTWGYEFMFAHTYDGTADSPFEDGLTRSFPDYCGIRE